MNPHKVFEVLAAVTALADQVTPHAGLLATLRNRELTDERGCLEAILTGNKGILWTWLDVDGDYQTSLDVADGAG